MIVVFAFAGKGPIDDPVVDLLVSGTVYPGSAGSILGAASFLLGAVKRAG